MAEEVGHAFAEAVSAHATEGQEIAGREIVGEIHVAETIQAGAEGTR